MTAGIHPLFIERHATAAKEALLELKRLDETAERKRFESTDALCVQMDVCRSLDVTWEEIAEVFGVSRQAVQQRYARAMARRERESSNRSNPLTQKEQT